MNGQFAKHLAAFVERLKVLRYSPATLLSREHCIRRFFRWLQAKPGGVQAQPGVRDVTKQTVRDYQEYLLGRYTTHTAHAHLIALRRFFEHLEATDALLVNPCEGVPLPKLEDRRPATFSRRRKSGASSTRPTQKPRRAFGTKPSSKRFTRPASAWRKWPG